MTVCGKQFVSGKLDRHSVDWVPTSRPIFASKLFQDILKNLITFCSFLFLTELLDQISWSNQNKYVNLSLAEAATVP